MKIKAILLMILITAVANTGFAREQDAPFGLVWGMTKVQAEKLGVRLEQSSSSDGLDIFKATSLPNSVSIAEFYSLTFDRTHHLQRIQMISKNITGDIYGTEGKEKYATLKDVLVKKYGQPTNGLERVGMELWNDADEFYQCLAYEGCGLWVAIFKHKESEQNILFALKGLGRGKGFIELCYEGPMWFEVVDALKQRRTKADEGAL